MGSDAGRSGERGSAMVIAILLTVVLSMLGLTFLMLGETESRISKNELRQAQSLYVGESAARIVKTWFDYPGTSLHFPDPSVVDRSLRLVVDETDPYGGAPTPADDSLGSFPYYKQGVDADADGDDDLFDRPYRAGADPLLHTFVGTEDGPDLRIDADDPAAAPFLIDLSNTLFGGFPAAASGIVARVARIDVYAPPYIRVSGSWSRYGMATVKVVSRIHNLDTDTVEGEREVRAVLGEIPYRGPYGPLHSCGDTSLVPVSGSPVSVHWGALTTAGDLDLNEPGDLDIAGDCLARSLPRDLPGLPALDPLWDFNADTTTWDTWRTGAVGDAVIDPWLRVVTEGDNDGQAPGNQIEPASSYPAGECCNYSGVAQRISITTCPLYDYATWKSIATEGRQDVKYFTWVSGDRFREHGTGTVGTFRELTDGREGLYFFDTEDADTPRDDNGDGTFDNLTPGIRLAGGTWSFRGFLYLNAESFQLDGVGGVAGTVVPPGEPFVDQDGDGEYDAGEWFVELDYPTAVGDPFVVRNSSPTPARRERGDPIAVSNVSLRGILFTSGVLLAEGQAQVYGTIVARGGVVQTTADGSLDTPDIYWDQDIVEDWPPPGLRAPRVTITSWMPDR